LSQKLRHTLKLLALAIFCLCQARAQTPAAPTISGLYEICVGVTGPSAQIKYWQQFGYRVGPIGELSAEEAKKLYGVNSKLISIRLLHRDAEHGLIRLMVWDKPTNDGLGLVRLITPGSRWTSTLTHDVLKIQNHAEAAKSPVSIVPPVWSKIYPTAPDEAFTGEVVGVRELIVLQPLTRQMFFERFGYTAHNYGRVDFDAKFRASQVTHSGLVFYGDDAESYKFYGDVLGLTIVNPEQRWDYEKLGDAAKLYGMKPGEYYYGTTLDNPLSGRAPDTAVSGRVLLRRIPTSLKDQNLIDRSRPGSLGYSLYTYRVTEIETYHAKVKASKATGVTDIRPNEFGEKSCSFIAPDGHFWTLVGK
jgi:hypothetical protein